MNNSTSMQSYCDEPLCDLGRYVKKESSAWTEVSTGTWPSSKRFWFPGVAIWADFRDFCRFWEVL